MTNQQVAQEALRPIARYKIGYATDDWGMRDSTPSGIPDPAGAWVRYKDHVAALVEAQQPAPTPQAASAPASVAGPMQFGGCPECGLRSCVARQCSRTVSHTAQALSGVQWQCGPQISGFTVPQADSQPAPVEVVDAMADSQYLAGVSAGWNAANADDPNAALQKLQESRAGYLKPLRAARAPADSVTAPAGGVVVTDDMVLAALRAQYPAAYGQYLRHPANGPKTSLRTESEIDTARRMIVAALSAAPIPPTHAADSVLEDAERWQTFIALPYATRAEWVSNLSLAPVLTQWVDAARKQGANHD